MAELFLDSIFDNIRTLVNVGEQERKNYLSKIEALEKINQNLLENLNACTNADQQRQMLDASIELISVLKIVTEEFKTVCNNCEWPTNEFNSLRIAIEHLKRIGAA